jgi:hypothetical protein
VRLAGLITVALCSLVATSGTAGASATGTDNGNGTVSVGAADGSSGGGASGEPSGGTGGGSVGGSTFCTSVKLVLNDEGGIAPGGATPGSWYSVSCYLADGSSVTQTEWIPDQAPAAAPTVTPYEVALQAEASIHLPEPTTATDPSSEAVVNLPTWLWIGASGWHAYSVGASVGSVSAVAVATPLSVSWSMGDGQSVICAGPGTPFNSGRPALEQSTNCSYDYPVTSAGEASSDGDPNDGSFAVTATVTWSVTWSSVGAAGGGNLPTLFTSSGFRLRVGQVESIDAIPGSERSTSGAVPSA